MLRALLSVVLLAVVAHGRKTSSKVQALATTQKAGTKIGLVSMNQAGLLATHTEFEREIRANTDSNDVMPVLEAASIICVAQQEAGIPEAELAKIKDVDLNEGGRTDKAAPYDREAMQFPHLTLFNTDADKAPEVYRDFKTVGSTMFVGIIKNTMRGIGASCLAREGVTVHATTAVVRPGSDYKRLKGGALIHLSGNFNGNEINMVFASVHLNTLDGHEKRTQLAAVLLQAHEMLGDSGAIVVAGDFNYRFVKNPANEAQPTVSDLVGMIMATADKVDDPFVKLDSKKFFHDEGKNVGMVRMPGDKAAMDSQVVQKCKELGKTWKDIAGEEFPAADVDFTLPEDKGGLGLKFAKMQKFSPPTYTTSGLLINKKDSPELAAKKQKLADDVRKAVIMRDTSPDSLEQIQTAYFDDADAASTPTYVYTSSTGTGVLKLGYTDRFAHVARLNSGEFGDVDVFMIRGAVPGRTDVISSSDHFGVVAGYTLS